MRPVRTYRISKKEFNLLRAAATCQDVPVATFVRIAVVNAAREVVRKILKEGHETKLVEQRMARGRGDLLSLGKADADQSVDADGG